MSEEIKKEERSLNFLEEIIEQDLASGKYKSIVTRFPPEVICISAMPAVFV
jgi:glutaminyl-tRNA synthetase